MNKVTSVVRNLHVSDLTKIAQITEVASEGEHRPKHNHAVSSLAARANVPLGGKEVGSNNYCEFGTSA